MNDDGIVPGGQIAGYILYIDDGYGGDFKPIFNSVGLTSQVGEFLATGLLPSLQYRFTV